MLLHKAVQTSPAKQKRPVLFLASRSAVGRLGDTMYIKGGHGGFLKVPAGLSQSLIDRAEKALRKRQHQVWVVVVLLLSLGLGVALWHLGAH